MNPVTNLSKDKYTLKPKSTETISFLGATPNHYRITNSGDTALFLGVSMMPTEDFFDMKIPPNTTKLYVDAYGHDEIYLYNPSDYDHNIIITSFTSEFDASVLAMSDMGVDFADVTLSGEFDATGDLKKHIANIYKALGNSTSDSYGAKTVKGIEEVKTVNTNNGTKIDGVKNVLSEKLDSVANSLKVNGNNTNINLSYVIELLQGLQNPETVTYNVQGFKKDIYVGESETYLVVAPEGHYFSRICQIETSEDIQMNLRKAKGSNYDDLMYVDAIMNNGFNCQYHQLEFRNTGTERTKVTVIAEIKPYRVVSEKVVVDFTSEEYLDLKLHDKIVDAKLSDGRLYSDVCKTNQVDLLINLKIGNDDIGYYDYSYNGSMLPIIIDTEVSTDYVDVKDNYSYCDVFEGLNPNPDISLSAFIVERNGYSI